MRFRITLDSHLLYHFLSVQVHILLIVLHECISNSLLSVAAGTEQIFKVSQTLPCEFDTHCLLAHLKSFERSQGHMSAA